MTDSSQFPRSSSIMGWFMAFRPALCLLIFTTSCVMSATEPIIEAKAQYVGFAGKQMTISWHFKYASMYGLVTISVTRSGIDTKLWIVEYLKNTNSLNIRKTNFPQEVFNNITDLKIDDKVMFRLIIKANPLLLSSYQIKYVVRFNNDWNSMYNISTVRIAKVPVVQLTTYKLPGMYIETGRKIQINCSANGFPSPQIVLKKSMPVQHCGSGFSNNCFKILKTKPPSRAKLVFEINSIQPADAGRYVCEATNIAGVDTKDTTIAVRYIKLRGTLAVTVPTEMGKSEELDCPIEGYPPVIYSWLKNKRQITALKGITIKMDKKDKFGDYTCKGQNDAGVETVVFSVVKNPRQSSANSKGGDKLGLSFSALLVLVLANLWLYLGLDSRMLAEKT